MWHTSALPHDAPLTAGGHPRAGPAALVILFTGVVFSLHLSCSSADQQCAPLLEHPESDVDIPLPVNCKLIGDVPADESTTYLENERKRRGLAFKAWIGCTLSGAEAPREFAFAHDPRWLPSYVPASYQFRQTVVISADLQASAQGSGVVGEVCLMPRTMYVSQVSGQCGGKFAVWK